MGREPNDGERIDGSAGGGRHGIDLVGEPWIQPVDGELERCRIAQVEIARDVRGHAVDELRRSLRIRRDVGHVRRQADPVVGAVVVEELAVGHDHFQIVGNTSVEMDHRPGSLRSVAGEVVPARGERGSEIDADLFPGKKWCGVERWNQRQGSQGDEVEVAEVHGFWWYGIFGS